MATPTDTVSASPEDVVPRDHATWPTRLAIWVPLLLLPSVFTVLRYTAPFLNADGVEQSVMSIQGPELFYWGQDRLFPLISWVASPIADPTANLWVCFVLQALCLHGLLLYLAVRGAAIIRRTSPGSTHSARATTVVTYLVLVAATNALLSPLMMQSLGTEGQPYAISWLFTALAFEAWRRGRWPGRVAAALLAFLALGINPSIILIAGFLALVEAVRTRRFATWVLFVGVLGVLFVVWSFLTSAFPMYPTPAREEAPSYLSFSFDIFSYGFGEAIKHVVGDLRPLRTLVVVLVALAATLVISDALRSRLIVLGCYFGGFTLLYVALFAGNEWVMMNAFVSRYFFPLQLLLVLAVSMPIAGAVLQLVDRVRASERSRARIPSWLPTAAALAAAALALAGPLRLPQDAPILTADDATESFVRSHDIRFISGNYWNMWPLMHGLLGGGRDAVFVAGLKAHGDPEVYRDTLASQLDEDGRARAVCVNEDVVACKTYLDYWTEPGWRPARGAGSTCPITPEPYPMPVPASCRVLTFKP